MAKTIDILRQQYGLKPHIINDPSKEAEWNALARLFVQRFQQIHDLPPDSLAGAHSFTLLDAVVAYADGPKGTGRLKVPDSELERMTTEPPMVKRDLSQINAYDDEPEKVAVWRCQSCGHIDDKAPLPKDREAYYANPKARKCPKCKSNDMSPEGF